MRKLVLFERWRQSFNQVKEELSQPTTLVLYDPQCELKVSADASSFGYLPSGLAKETIIET